VLIDVGVDGARFQEMHVDGGAIAQLFLYPSSLDPTALPIRRRQTAYIIRNARRSGLYARALRLRLPRGLVGSCLA
jgi:hypothetical protein